MTTPSPEQSAIFSHVKASAGNLIVSAVAGSGKTTTLIEALKLLPGRDPETFLFPAITFLAFNKQIAETLKSRCPAHVSCSTFHSLGLRALTSSLSTKPEVVFQKVSKLLYSRLERNDPDFRSISSLVSLAKSVWPMIETEKELTALADRYALDFQTPKASIATAYWAFARSIADSSTIDFDDMLFLPLLLNSRFPEQDFVAVDEAQDTNDIQLELLERLAKIRPIGRDVEGDDLGVYSHPSPTRYLFVGDPNQAIYAFRGANADSMTRIASRFSCSELPLSVSWRCSQSVVAEAQRILNKPL